MVMPCKQNKNFRRVYAIGTQLASEQIPHHRRFIFYLGIDFLNKNVVLKTIEMQVPLC